jgi:CRISPR-associated protein Cmr3
VILNWYRFKPVDTLFFRGAEPMEMGESHISTPVFPPSPHTIAGALRTAVLVRHGINFSYYASKSFDNNDILESIGRYDEQAPFDITGPLFMYGNSIFVPAPYAWYMNKSHKANLNEYKKAEIDVIRSFQLESDLIKTSRSDTYWAKPVDDELISLGSYWMQLDDLNMSKSRIEIYSLNYFIGFEQRVGVALENSRKVRESHIYSFNHARLKDGCDLVFGVNRKLPLDDKGVLKLGAEQRFGRYEILKDALKLQNKGDLHMALSIVPKSEDANKNIVATGKIIYLGGWDLARGFHKDMIGYFPTGSVFKEKINNNCIAIH